MIITPEQAARITEIETAAGYVNAALHDIQFLLAGGDRYENVGDVLRNAFAILTSAVDRVRGAVEQARPGALKDPVEVGSSLVGATEAVATDAIRAIERIRQALTETHEHGDPLNAIAATHVKIAYEIGELRRIYVVSEEHR